MIGKKYDDIRVQLGEGQFDPDLENQITGMKTGDERRIEKIYPKSAGKNLAGKVEQYNISMQKIEKDYITVSPIGDDGFVFTRTRKCVGINWEHAGL